MTFFQFGWDCCLWLLTFFSAEFLDGVGGGKRFLKHLLGQGFDIYNADTSGLRAYIKQEGLKSSEKSLRFWRREMRSKDGVQKNAAACTMEVKNSFAVVAVVCLFFCSSFSQELNPKGKNVCKATG